ncbi:MAG: glycosyltransferase [Paludibacter sp.]
MTKKNSAEYIFEASWEVCNMVGGIYTVLSTRAATLVKTHGDKLVFIGPDVWKETDSPYFIEDKTLFGSWTESCAENYPIKIRTGRWNIPGSPVAVLVNFDQLFEQKNEIYGHFWSLYGVDSIAAYGDYDESSMFGYATGMVIESFYKYQKLNEATEVVAHFNEWMTTFGAFYIREKLPQIATLFTTHATSIGRSIAGNHKPLYDYLNEYNGDQMAYELNMVSKHSTEKKASHLVDCFTTVSEITAIECAQLLDKEVDIVTPNGFENDFVPTGKLFNTKRTEARKTLKKTAETLLGYQLSDDCVFVGTAGRYEYKNKGIDIFIESLKYLKDKTNSTEKEQVAFIMVPAWIKGARTDLQYSITHNQYLNDTHNRFSTHELHDYYNDNVINALNWFHITNKPGERIKVIFIPSYLDGNDGILNTSYYDLLIGLDLTVFPSYYEPWGYTPLESVAFSVPTITTSLSGFGQWVSHTEQHIETGVGVIHRSDYNGTEVAHKIANMLFDFEHYSAEEIKSIRKKAQSIAKKALWSKFITHYETAYDIAIRNKNIRNAK